MTGPSDELRELERKATPAPWTVMIESAREAYIVDVMARPEPLEATGISDQDAVLIAAARNALPLLLDVASAAAPLRACVKTFEGTRLSDTEFGRLRAKLWPTLEAIAEALAALRDFDNTPSVIEMRR